MSDDSTLIADSLRALGDGIDEMRRDRRRLVRELSAIKTELAVISADVALALRDCLRRLA